MDTVLSVIIDVALVSIGVIVSGTLAVLWRRVRTLEDLGDIRQRKTEADSRAIWRVLGEIEADSREVRDEP